MNLDELQQFVVMSLTRIYLSSGDRDNEILAEALRQTGKTDVQDLTEEEKNWALWTLAKDFYKTHRVMKASGMLPKDDGDDDD